MLMEMEISSVFQITNSLYLVNWLKSWICHCFNDSFVNNWPFLLYLSLNIPVFSFPTQCVPVTLMLRTETSCIRTGAVMSFQNSDLQTQNHTPSLSVTTFQPRRPSEHARMKTHKYTLFCSRAACIKTLGDWPPPPSSSPRPTANPFSPLSSHWPPQRQTIVYFHSPPWPCWSEGGSRIVTLLSGPP